MTRRPGSGKAPGAASPGSGFDRQTKTPRLALPADLGRSLRLLDDAQLDRLAEGVADEIRRRGRGALDRTTVADRSAKRTQAKAARAKPNAPDRAAIVTPGQERMILAAHEAGLRPAAIAKEFRVSRSTVQHVITAARRDPPQDGAIDGRGTKADRHAQPFDRARFRRDDRRRRPTGRSSARIKAWLGLEPVNRDAASGLRQNRQKHDQAPIA